MNSLKSDKNILKEFKMLEKSAKTAEDYAQLAREMLNTINEYQGYSKEVSKKCKLWASELYYIAGDLIIDENGDQIKSWDYWQLSNKLKEE
jgi:hypothetical protein